MLLRIRDSLVPFIRDMCFFKLSNQNKGLKYSIAYVTMGTIEIVKNMKL